MTEKDEATSDPAAASQTVVTERIFLHAPEKVWRALTEQQLLAKWLLKNDFEPVTGRRFQFRADPVPQWDGLIECEVLVVDPLKRLSYRWTSMGLGTIVLFILTPAEGGTHLRMEQSGFSPDHQFAFKGATYGWQRFFIALEGVLDKELS